jgi:hypothetical protein
MSKYQHSRQHMPIHGFKSSSTARKLIALSQQPAPHVLRSTVFDDTIESEVSFQVSEKTQTIGGLSIGAGQLYYLVASPKFQHRFYVVAKLGDDIVCSAQEAAVKERCIQAVEHYQACIGTYSTLTSFVPGFVPGD